jgi:halimadienyl-diphosphate synthase
MKGMPMDINRAFTDLAALIGVLGDKGGICGPSIYDTAQALRFAPLEPDSEDVTNWLLSQQESDGGWGDPRIPYARDIPTLATVIALRPSIAQPRINEAVQAGIAFIRRQAGQWADIPEDIPIAAELILPALVDQANAVGVTISKTPYKQLRAIGRERRARVTPFEARPATPLVHSWEAWARNPDETLFDSHGSIGHSPAATAAWLMKVRRKPTMQAWRIIARRYLQRASLAVDLPIYGLMPAVWPYGQNEQTVGTYLICLSGLLDHEPTARAIYNQSRNLQRDIRPHGFGISTSFTPDGDNTAMAMAVMAQCGDVLFPDMLQIYLDGGEYLTYPHEMQRSISASIHAAHAAALTGMPEYDQLIATLLRRRNDIGTWSGDKWHASWLYPTSHMIHALLAGGRDSEAQELQIQLAAQQQADGAWSATAARCEESAYAVCALLALERAELLGDVGMQSLKRGGEFLLQAYDRGVWDRGTCWIAKALYRPSRIAQCAILSTTLAYYRRFHGLANLS